MRLTEYETTIKSKIQQNPNDQTIYEDLQKMILIFLTRKKACKSANDYEDISYLLAGDMYLSIINGTRYNYYLGYLEKVYLRYVLQYYADNFEPDIVHIEDPTDLEYLMDYTSNPQEYNEICDKCYIENIKTIVDQIMIQSCKYDSDTTAYLNLKLSLVVSLIRDTPTYYHLLPEHQFYLNMIIKNFQSKILSDIRS